MLMAARGYPKWLKRYLWVGLISRIVFRADETHNEPSCFGHARGAAQICSGNGTGEAKTGPGRSLDRPIRRHLIIALAPMDVIDYGLAKY